MFTVPLHSYGRPGLTRRARYVEHLSKRKSGGDRGGDHRRQGDRTGRDLLPGPEQPCWISFGVGVLTLTGMRTIVNDDGVVAARA